MGDNQSVSRTMNTSEVKQPLYDLHHRNRAFRARARILFDRGAAQREEHVPRQGGSHRDTDDVQFA